MLNYNVSKRALDLVIAISLLPIIIPMGIIISFGVLIFSGLPIIHWSTRVGLNNIIFMMPKFRTMNNPPLIATDLLENPDLYVTTIGRFLRKSSLDELPQILTIIKGEMSFVGPRPALFNQNELIEIRNKNGIDKVLPGLTGLAQINGRDRINLMQKISFEVEYLRRRSIFFDLMIIIKTIILVVSQNNISH